MASQVGLCFECERILDVFPTKRDGCGFANTDVIVNMCIVCRPEYVKAYGDVQG